VYPTFDARWWDEVVALIQSRGDIPVIISGVRIPQPMLVIYNLYDVLSLQHGHTDVHGVGVLDWVVDPNVLSLDLPPRTVELLGLSAEEVGSRRLAPVRLSIHNRQATIAPFLTTGNQVVIGHVALTALGLKYDPEWGLMDDTYPSR
jgi:hypothetical protein